MEEPFKLDRIEKPDNDTKRESLRETTQGTVYVYKSKKLTLEYIGSKITEEISNRILDEKDGIYRFNGLISPIQLLKIKGNLKGKQKYYKVDESILSSANELPENAIPIHTVEDIAKAQKFNRSSLRLGQCEVLNPLYQFNENDDVRSNPYYPNYGRIYNETIRRSTVKLIVEPGKLIFKTSPLALGSMLGGSGKQIRKYIKGNRGENILSSTFSSLIGVFRAAARSLIGFSKIYRFKPDMKLYNRYFNQLIGELGTYFGVIKYGSKIEANKDGKYNIPGEFSFIENQKEEKNTLMQTLNEAFSGLAENAAKYVDELFDKKDEEGNVTKKNEEVSEEDLKEALESGKIKKDRETEYFEPTTKSSKDPNLIDAYNNQESGSIIESEANRDTIGYDVDDIANDPDNVGSDNREYYSGKSYLGGINILRLGSILPNYSSIYGTSTGQIKNSLSKINHKLSMLHFRIENIGGISESFNNSTQKHPIEDTINQRAGSSHMSQYSMDIDLDKFGSSLKSTGEAVVNMAKTKVTKVAQAKTMGEAGALFSGAGGQIALPEVYSGSSFQRNISVKFKLYSPYGDPLSIFEAVHIPHMALKTLALPQQGGKYTHLSPFILRLNSPGLFSMNLAIIESFSIDRGDSANDMTLKDGLFKSMSIDVNFKDLLPVLSLSMDIGIFSALHRVNENMRQNLMLLANFPLHKQRFFLDRLSNFKKRFVLGLRNTFNWSNIAFTLADNGVVKIFSNVFSKRTPGVFGDNRDNDIGGF